MCQALYSRDDILVTTSVSKITRKMVSTLYLCASLTGVAAEGLVAGAALNWGKGRVTTRSPASNTYPAEAQRSLLPQGLRAQGTKNRVSVGLPGRQPEASAPDGELLVGAMC